MPITLDGTTGITVPGVTDTGNLSVTGTSTLTGAVSQTGSSTAASFIPTGSTVPANGMYLSAANTLNLATNTTNQMSISSTGIVTGTAGNLMLVQGTAQASTSGTVIDFTGIPSWAKRITIMFSGVSTNGTSDIQLQLGDSGGFETSGYGGALLRSGPSSIVTVQYPTTGFLLINDIGAADVHSGMATISLLGSNAWCGSSQISETGFSGIFTGSGAKTLSDTLTQIRITTVGGVNTFDAGTINIQYE